MAKVALIALYDEYALGIRYISSYLKAHGHECHVILFKSMAEARDDHPEGPAGGYYHSPAYVTPGDLDALYGLLRQIDPIFVGMSYTSSFPGLAERIARWVKGELGCPVVVGGIDATLSPELNIEFADVVCVGEGEISCLELIEGLEEGRLRTEIPSFWVRGTEGIVRNPVRPLLQDLDALPWCDWAWGNKYYVGNDQVYVDQWPPFTNLRTNLCIITARGCPYQCTYCCHNALRQIFPRGNGKYLRRRSVEDTIDEIEFLLKAFPEANYVEFQDDLFTIFKPWIKDFTPVYKERVALPFYCNMYATNYDDEMLALLKEAGVDHMVMGVQTGSERVLKDIYKRRMTQEQILKATHAVSNAGIHMVIDLIYHNPMETEEDHRETFKLLMRMPKDFTINPNGGLALYEKHSITEQAVQMGLEPQRMEGRHAAFAGSTDLSRFWRGVFIMTQFSEIPRETLKDLIELPGLREKPEIVEGLAAAFVEGVFINSDNQIRKSQAIRDLDHRLQSITGSARYKAFRALKSVKDSVLPGGRNGGNGSRYREAGSVDPEIIAALCDAGVVFDEEAVCAGVMHNRLADGSAPDATRFAQAVLLLSRFWEVPRETLRAIAATPCLADNPHVVEGIARGFAQGILFDLERDIRKAQVIEDRNYRIGSIEGSRLYRVFKQLDEFKHRFHEVDEGGHERLQSVNSPTMCQKLGSKVGA